MPPTPPDPVAPHAATVTTPRAARSRLGATLRYHRDDAPAVDAARRDLAAANVEQYITRLLAETPPLTAEQKLHLTRLLTAPAADGAA